MRSWCAQETFEVTSPAQAPSTTRKSDVYLDLQKGDRDGYESLSYDPGYFFGTQISSSYFGVSERRIQVGIDIAQVGIWGDHVTYTCIQAPPRRSDNLPLPSK